MTEVYFSVALAILIATTAAICVREFVRMLEVYEDMQLCDEILAKVQPRYDEMAQAFTQMVNAMSLFAEGFREVGRSVAKKWKE